MKTANENEERVLSANRQQRMSFYGHSLHGYEKVSRSISPGLLNYSGRKNELCFEVYFTWLIELFWSKERIMEVYLNSIEMGKGIYGAQAAAKYKFNTTAAKLTAGQCALIAATLPNPIRFNSAKPSRYILKRQGQILRLMKLVPKFPPTEKSVKKKKGK